MKPGDSVRFSAQWCRSTGNFFGPVPFLRGTIVDVLTPPVRPGGPCIVVVEWNDGTTGKALSSNLESTEVPVC